MSLPASKRFVSINCNDYVKVPKINDISVNSTVHDDCLLKRINIGIVKAPITVSLPNLKKGQLLCSSDFLKPLLVTSSHTYEGHCCCTWSWDAPTLNLLKSKSK